jgi:hypothetical protein
LGTHWGSKKRSEYTSEQDASSQQSPPEGIAGNRNPGYLLGAAGEVGCVFVVVTAFVFANKGIKGVP